jgi:hypothetical protein
MQKDLHDMDELFRSGLSDFEATPSAGVKENIDAALDKQDAEKYKKRFIIWKRAALLLLVLLAGFVLYESGVLKMSGNDYAAKNHGGDKNDVSAGNNEKINQNNSTPVNQNNEPVTGENIVTQKNNTEGLQNQQTTGVPGNPVFTGDKSAEQKNKPPYNLLFPFIQKQDPLFSATSSQQDKKTNPSSTDDDVLKINNQGVESLDKRVGIAKVAGGLIKKISLLPSLTVNYSPLFTNKNNNPEKKKINSFKPFWTISPFVSYDQVGYQLDSDEASAVNSIKFREANEPSFSIGSLLGWQLTQRFSLQSGIVYRNTAIGMKPQKTYAFKDPTGDVAYKYITSSGYAYFKPGFGPPPNVGDSLTTAEAKHTLENISVPLMVKYTVVNKKLSVTPGAGIEANFITKKNLEVDIEDPFNREIVVIRKLNGTKPFYLSFIAEADIKYTINKKVAVNIRPVYRHAVSPITKNNVVETFPRSFGIGAGVTIKLR